MIFSIEMTNMFINVHLIPSWRYRHGKNKLCLQDKYDTGKFYTCSWYFFFFVRQGQKTTKTFIDTFRLPTFSSASFAIFLMEIRRFLRKFVMRYRLIRSRCISERASFFKYSRLVCMGSLMWCALYGMKLLIPHPYNLFLQQSITLSFHQPIRLHP